MNKTKKVLAVLSTAALFGTTPAAVVAPFVTATVAHAAASSMTALTVPTISNQESSTQLGTIKIVIPAGALNNGDTVSFRLPSGVSFRSNFGAATSDSTVMSSPVNAVYVPDTISSSAGVTVDNGVNKNMISVTPVPNNNTKEWQISVTGTPSLTNDAVIYIRLGDINVNGASDGPLDISFDAPSTSGFPTGTVTVANVNTAGTVSISAVNTDTSNDTFTFDLRLKENTKNALQLASNSVKVKLPSGYKWDAPATTHPTVVYGGKVTWTDLSGTTHNNDDITNYVSVSVNGDELTISYNIPNVDRTQPISEAQPSLLQFTNLQFHVDDENAVKLGDIVATVTGQSSTDQSQIVVGTYGEFNSSVSASQVTNLVAGKPEQKLGDIVIQESMKGTLVQGRTITLTLPDGVIWQPVYDKLTANPPAQLTSSDVPGSIETTKGLQVKFLGYSGTDYRTAKFQVVNPSNNDGATFTLKNAEVAVRPDLKGDVNVEVGGTAGVTGNVKVATVAGGLTVAASKVADVKIGEAGQSVGDITITESAAGVLSHKAGANTVTLELPGGVAFYGTPTVNVTQGDLRITNVRTESKGNVLKFDVDTESSQPSTITISNVKLYVDRSVAAGPIILKVKGGETAKYSSWSDNILLGQTAIANVATPSPGETSVTATFTVGSTTYTVNGEQKTMDVAPYLKNDGRVMLPVRFVANALGVDDNHIIWNGDDQSVTIFKGNTVVKLTVGSKTMIVNGVAVTMDVAPELYNDGRVMLPLRWVGQALGAQIDWNQDTQTVTVTAQ